MDGGQDDNVSLQKDEATTENNGASNHSSGYMACLDRDKELIEKGSDAQVSNYSLFFLAEYEQPFIKRKIRKHRLHFWHFCSLETFFI